MPRAGDQDLSSSASFDWSWKPDEPMGTSTQLAENLSDGEGEPSPSSASQALATAAHRSP